MVHAQKLPIFGWFWGEVFLEVECGVRLQGV